MPGKNTQVSPVSPAPNNSSVSSEERKEISPSPSAPSANESAIQVAGGVFLFPPVYRFVAFFLLFAKFYVVFSFLIYLVSCLSFVFLISSCSTSSDERAETRGFDLCELHLE